MITEIRIPQLGRNDEIVTLVEWFCKDQSRVKEGEVICSFETTKILYEIESPREGYLRIEKDSPQELPTQSIIGWIVDVLEEKQLKVIGNEPKTKVKEMRATKKAQQLAESLGIKLEGIPCKGIIKEKDVRHYIAGTKSAEFYAKEIPNLPPDINKNLMDRVEVMNSIQKKISEKVTSSLKNNISAHLSIELRIDKILKWLEEKINSTKKIVRLNDLIIKATACAIEEFPLLNAFCWNGAIVYYKAIDINMIIEYENNLFAPIIKDANKKSIEEIAYESALLQMKLARGQLTVDDLVNGTFTITNMASFGVQHFLPIINTYQSAILGVTAEKDICTMEEGQVKQTKVISLELTYDHRIINGGMGANFLNAVRESLETFY